ncbi:hypothetical protein KAH94_05760 [bacterium]|nr:hypothetical protein [bacterium]
MWPPRKKGKKTNAQKVREAPALTVHRIARDLRTEFPKLKPKKCINCGFPYLWYIHGCADCGELEFTGKWGKVKRPFWPEDYEKVACLLEEEYIWAGNGFEKR